MQRFLLTIFSLFICLLSHAGDIKHISITYDYISDNPNETQIEQALENESKDISSKIPKNSKIVTMCIEGKGMSSKKFSEYFDNLALLGNSNITFIIGSSYGLSSKIKNMSDLKLSMSEMTFPHQLARVMLLEQIYRALMISSGRKYDK